MVDEQATKSKRSFSTTISLMMLLGWLILVPLTGILNAPKEFDQLQMARGKLISIAKGGRDHTGGKLELSSQDGKTIGLRRRFSDQHHNILKTMIGDEITVFYQENYSIFLYKYKQIEAIKSKDEFIISYNYERQKKFQQIDYYLLVFLVSLFVVTLISHIKKMRRTA